MNKKNYVHYKTSVFEFIEKQPHKIRVAILTRFEFIEYGLDNHWIERNDALSEVIVETAGKEFEFLCRYRLEEGIGVIEVVNARLVNQRFNKTKSKLRKQIRRTLNQKPN